jgi:hypothetical protein
MLVGNLPSSSLSVPPFDLTDVDTSEKMVLLRTKGKCVSKEHQLYVKHFAKCPYVPELS